MVNMEWHTWTSKLVKLTREISLTCHQATLLWNASAINSKKLSHKGPAKMRSTEQNGHHRGDKIILLMASFFSSSLACLVVLGVDSAAAMGDIFTGLIRFKFCLLIPYQNSPTSLWTTGKASSDIALISATANRTLESGNIWSLRQRGWNGRWMT